MRQIIEKMFASLILVLIINSCSSSRKIKYESEVLKKYDEAAYDFLFVEALKQKLSGNAGEALKYFEQCIRLNPLSDASYYQMAQIVIAGGDIENAKRYARKAYYIDGNNIWYVSMLSGIYYQQGQIDSAIIVYEKAAGSFTENQNLHVTLANLYLEKGDFDKALGIYKQLEIKYGINETTTPGYLQSLSAKGYYDEALKKAQQLIEAYPAGIQHYAHLADILRSKGEINKAQEVYDKLLKENPENPQILLSASDFLLKEKKYEDLLSVLDNVSINSNIGREDKISLFAGLIGKDIKEEKITERIIMSMMILESVYKNDDVIVLIRPEFLEKADRKHDAIARLEEIITSTPDNYYAWEKLLFIYMELGDYKNLMQRGEQCASKFNRSYIAKLLYANGALEYGKYDIAIEELRKAEILAGNNTEFLVQVLTMRADAFYRKGEFVKAFETYDEAVSLSENDLTILNNYAYYLAEQEKDLKKAEEMIRQVIEQESDNSTFLDTYAWVLFKRGKVRDAIKIMDGIIGKEGNSEAQYLEHYGFMMKKINRCKKAIESWERAMVIDSTKINLNQEIENCRD